MDISGCGKGTIGKGISDELVHVITSSSIPFKCCGLGLRVMASEKDFFVDNPSLTTIVNLNRQRKK